MMMTMATQICSKPENSFLILDCSHQVINNSLFSFIDINASIFKISDYLLLIMKHSKKILIERRFLGSLEVLLIAQLGWKLFEDLMRTSRLLRKNLFLNFLILRTPCCIFFALWNWEQRRCKRLFMMHKKQLLGATTGNVIENVLYRLFRQALKCS